jgi:molybdopterin/thiamine biosynthesis adenylyltransferase
MNSMSLRVGEQLWASVAGHIHQPDRDEHGGALLCGIATDHTGKRRLLARTFVPAIDGVDYVPGTRGYRHLKAAFIRKVVLQAREQGLVCLLVHGHGAGDKVEFSKTDFASHQRGYPSLLDVAGQSVGALVLATNAVAGDIWNTDGTRDILDTTVVVGGNIVRLKPTLAGRPPQIRAEDDRQGRLFGSAGQNILRKSRIGIVGAGGAGMIGVEMLTRLGAGELIVIDPDKVELTNLNRLPGALRRDASGLLTHPNRPAWLRKLGSALSVHKTRVAKRLARQAGQGTKVTTFPVNVTDVDAVTALIECDFILLAADSPTARNLVNVIAHQYLIPVLQVGAKVNVDDQGNIGRVYSIVRPITPDSGCFRCAGLIDYTQLAREALAEDQRQQADYGTGEPAPSVIMLNGVAVSAALTHMVLALTGLRTANHSDFLLYDARTSAATPIEPYRDADCTICGANGVAGLGDLKPLPLPLIQDQLKRRRA